MTVRPDIEVSRVPERGTGPTGKREPFSLNRILARPMLALIRVYQILLRPFVPDCCRFVPSCSEYSTEAFRRHGFLRGCALTVRRLLRCQPFCPGGYDPVPEKTEKASG